MARYIPKDALVAEIKRRKEINKYRDTPDSLFEDEGILSFITSLEVKEVDFENAYKEFVEDNYVYSKLTNNIVGKAIAKHFFELGLKAQKGE